MMFSDARKAYLEQIYQRYNIVTLPLGPGEGFALQSIYQPLALHRDPVVAANLERDQRRPLLSEQDEQEKDLPQGEKRILVKNGEEALAMSAQGRLVILGGPGTGKTTTLKYLVRCRSEEALANPQALLPIFLSLADLARSGKTLQAYLADSIADMGIERDYAQALWEAIMHGRAFVALDSLDEVEPAQRVRMIELVNSLASQPGNTWLVGSRFTEYKGGQFHQASFAEWELLPLDAGRRHELASRLFSSSASASPEIFIKQLEAHSHASSWGKNPLLFSLAAIVFLQTRSLPAARVPLYREVVTAVLSTRESDEQARNQLLQTLTGLAFWLYQYKGRTFTSQDLFTYLEHNHQQTSQEPALIIKNIIRSGLLDLVARDTYGFRHQTFQEYLAAAGLAHQLTSSDRTLHEQAWQFAWSKRTYSRWTEILRMLFGILAHMPQPAHRALATRWLEQLLAQRTTEEGDPGNLGLELVIKSLVENTSIAGEQSQEMAHMEKEAVSHWLEELLESYQQDRAAKMRKFRDLTSEIVHLQNCGTEAVLEQLLNALDKPGLSHIDQILIKLGDWFSTETLLTMLQGEDGKGYYIASEILKENGQRLSLDIMLALLQDKRDPIRQKAKQILENQHEHLPNNFLLSLLHIPEKGVQRLAATILKKRGQSVPLEPLIALLQHRNINMRRAALLALGGQGQRVPLELLLPHLQSRDKPLRLAVLQTLGELGEHIPPEPLLTMLEDREADVRRAAFLALANQGERVPLEPILAMLDDPDAHVQGATIQALSKQERLIPLEPVMTTFITHDWYAINEGATEAVIWPLLERQANLRLVETLKFLLEHRKQLIRERAYYVIEKFGTRLPVEFLLSLLHNQIKGIRCAAIEALGNHSEAIPFEPLFALLQDPEPDVMLAAALALAKHNQPVPLEPLLALFDHTFWYRREKVVQILQQQKMQISPELLLVHFQNNSSEILRASLKLLTERGQPVPLEILQTFLQHPNDEVREAAILLLGKAGKQIPIEMLLALQYDSDTDTAIAASIILEEQQERVPSEKLLTLLHTDHWPVQRVALQTLLKRDQVIPFETLSKLLRNSSWDIKEAADAVDCQSIPLEELAILLQKANRDGKQRVIQIIARRTDQASRDYLLTLLKDAEVNIRKATLSVLAREEADKYLEPLLTLIKDKDLDVRLRAIHELKTHIPTEQLLALLKDKNGLIRWAAVVASSTQREHIPDRSILALLKDKSSKVRRAAIQVWGTQKELLSLDELLAMFHDGAWYVRETILQVLEERGERVPLEIIQVALQDSADDVRIAASELLVQQDRDRGIDHTLSLLRDKNHYVRSRAIQLLGELDAPIPTVYLMPLFHDYTVSEEKVMNVLKKQVNRITLDSLLTLLIDKEDKTRKAALEVLEVYPEPIPLEPLIEASIEDDSEAREIAFRILHKHAPDDFNEIASQALPVLEGRIEGHVFTSLSQITVAQRIGELGSTVPALLDHLTKLLDWPHWQVRLSAIKAFGDVRKNIPDAALRRLLELRRDPDSKLREAADDALAEILSLETGIEDD